MTTTGAVIFSSGPKNSRRGAGGFPPEPFVFFFLVSDECFFFSFHPYFISTISFVSEKFDEAACWAAHPIHQESATIVDEICETTGERKRKKEGNNSWLMGYLNIYYTVYPIQQPAGQPVEKASLLLLLTHIADDNNDLPACSPTSNRYVSKCRVV